MNAAGIVLQAPDDRVLFLKRASSSDHPGTWAFPAGGIEDGETPEVAARRETAEETGIKDAGELQEIHRKADDEGTFTTFHARVAEHVVPRLNDEHVAHAWAPLSDPPMPLHPGVAAMLTEHAEDATLCGDENLLAMDWASIPRPLREPMAIDRASVRSMDHDGRLHVAVTNISKANVCPYLGREIPGSRELGLDPDKIYQLYRDPEELARAVPTFNNIPLLSKHVEVSAADHQPEFVVGSTGTDAAFVAPYMRNSLVIWAKDMIQAVEDEEQKELSSAYRYRADMTPGEVGGVRYDGVMRDIIGNHVALVKEGRAGADVVVGDSKEELNMAKLSRKAVLTQGALSVYLLPKLAQDAKINIMPAIKGLTQKNFKEKKPVLAAWVKEATSGKLAKDASVEDVVTLLDQLENIDAPDIVEAATGAEVVASDPVDDTGDPKEAFLKSKLSEDDFAEYQKIGAKAADADPDKDDKDDKKDKEKDDKANDKEPVTKAAMDEAVKKGAEAAAKAATEIQKQIRDAEKVCRPYVGELAISFDSAEQVYRKTLEMLGVPGVNDVHASALPVILKQHPLPGTKKPSATLAADASVSDFAKRYPGASRIGNA
jgi:8-oxo-dGTP pyrophosphatase MutT (NUDIX family)